jgi:hypothetical protein
LAIVAALAASLASVYRLVSLADQIADKTAAIFGKRPQYNHQTLTTIIQAADAFELKKLIIHGLADTWLT